MEDGYFPPTKIYKPCKLWREATDPNELVIIILQQNKRHLQHAYIKEGYILNNEIKECLLSCTRKVAKKKFSYQHSPHLTSQGIALHFWKALLSEKSRKVSLGKR